MSDTRHHPPVPPSSSGADPDAEEEAPTGVIGRITGEWPAPDGGLPKRKPRTPQAAEPGSDADEPAAAPRGRHEGPLPAPVEDAFGAPAHGIQESAPETGSGAPTQQASQGSSGADGGQAGNAAFEKQPLPVRKPRKRGAARLGMPPDSAPQPQGFDYFGAGRAQGTAPQAENRPDPMGDGAGWPRAFPESGPRNLADAFPGAGRRQPGASLWGGQNGPDMPPRPGAIPRAGQNGPDMPTPAFGADAPAFPAATPPGFPDAFGTGTPSFPDPAAPAAFDNAPAGGAPAGGAFGRRANPFADTTAADTTAAANPFAADAPVANPFADTAAAANPFTEAPAANPFADAPAGGPPFPDAGFGQRGRRGFPEAAPQEAFQSSPAPGAPAPAWPGHDDVPGDFDPWRRSGQDGAAEGPHDLRQTGPFGRPPRAPMPLPAWAGAPTSSDDPFARHAPRQDGVEETEPEQEQAPRAKKPRDPYLDNVKFVGIALVPIGHSLVPTLAADSARAAYLFIYVFHMPLFVIVSGYLSRNFWNSNAKTNKLVDTFLVPYVIVELGYAALRTAFGHKFSITITDPAWLNWYLLALLFWRLSTPVWKRMRYPFVISVVVYLFAGFSELSGDFSMDRFFGLLPFFVLGLVLKPEVFDFLKRRWVQVLSVVVLLGAAGVAIFLAKNYSVKLGPVYYKNSYKDLHLVWWKGMALRTGLLVAALAMSAAVMSLIPRRETWFTDLGTRTLYCYLLHGVPVMIAKEMGWLNLPWLYGPLGVAAIAASGFALAIVLCLPITRTAFKWLLEPRLTWLYRRPSVQAK